MREASGGLCIIAVGLFILIFAIKGDKWFDRTDGRKPMFISRLGRDGSRMFYAALGLMSILVGILMIVILV
ncbi:hypothetical protein [Ruminococcus albus]|uniref:hypothetical protein n=1 Tax=Ruminococcus albus TaxID=1264 RepID=UPI000942F118|nr:hypothetical protein [Ruminococcus albus]